MKLKEQILPADLAQQIGARLILKTNLNVTGINEIHMVEHGDITFVDHPKYYKKALESKASFIIINSEVECPDDKALFISDDPFRDYVMLCKKYRPFESLHQNISPSATIGEGTLIMPGAIVGNHVSIGKNCVIHPNVTIYDHTQIGNHVIIHAGTVIGADAFYYKKRPDAYDKMYSCGRVVIGDDVEIGASCCIDRGVSGDTQIGQGTKMDNQVHIGHDTVVGKHCLFAAQVGIAGVVTIEDEVILWGQVGVQKDLTIGKGAVILGQSGIMSSLEGGKTYFGSPVRDHREKLRELALLKKLPEVFDKLK
ncbi:MAG TPA: UDP-3-O-(3-hydroxymyristoyl)glucosamine N-acyltransferase [Bacteroidia bacterium]|nr:UDP-3-O-(3-hydroxymyristoyl)glucosamine N-acyltransferase [Bacteroidia bacterium]